MHVSYRLGSGVSACKLGSLARLSHITSTRKTLLLSVIIQRRDTPQHQTRKFKTGRGLSREAESGRLVVPAPERGLSKLFKDADAAVADLQSGSTILSAGFGLCGTAGGISGIHASASLLAHERQTLLSPPSTGEELTPFTRLHWFRTMPAQQTEVDFHLSSRQAKSRNALCPFWGTTRPLKGDIFRAKSPLN